MKTTFHIRQPYRDRFMACAEQYRNVSPAIPERFIEKMERNIGMAGILDEEGLEKKNPLIIALGDSVTAGHFESLIPDDPLRAKDLLPVFRKRAELIELSKTDPALAKEKERLLAMPPVEVYDARESYIEKFRDMLISRYELTSVSILNAGIAGDNLISMARRADRDVIRYQPDLVLINGSLNWDETLGSLDVFTEVLQKLVRRIKTFTEADIILLTPNGDLPSTLFETFGIKAKELTTSERCERIRQVAYAEKVCLADVRKVWEIARDAGCPWEELLANRVNHPSVEGHEVYAKVLMQLFNCKPGTETGCFVCSE